MTRYKSRRQYHSRLAKQESKRMKRQTVLIIFITIALMILLIVVGIPLLSKFAIFIGELGNNPAAVEQTDTIPPQTPTLSSPPEATNSAMIDLSGFSEPAATVTLFQNNQEKIKTIVDNSGRFEFLSVDLVTGNNSFYTIAKDSAENSSQRSLTRSVTYDTEPPNLIIDSPEEGDTIVGATRQTTTVTGSTDPGSKVTLNDNFVVLKGDGSFQTQHALTEGENKLIITSTDKAGNSTTETITVTYSRD